MYWLGSPKARAEVQAALKLSADLEANAEVQAVAVGERGA
jgi:hypothetical protein